MSKSYRITVTGRPKRDLDLDLLAQAILTIAEQQLQQNGEQEEHNLQGDEQ